MKLLRCGTSVAQALCLFVTSGACGGQAPPPVEPVAEATSNSEAKTAEETPTEGETARSLLMGAHETPLSKVDSDLSAFRGAATKMGLAYVAPEGFSRTPFVDNEDFSYDYAVISNDKRVEIRMALRPTAESLPPGAPPEFARVFFDTGISNLTNGGRTGDTYDADNMVTKEDFGADETGAVIINWHDEEFSARHFGKGYGIAVIVYLHKNDQGSAYVFLLGRDRETLENRLSDELMKTLKFVQAGSS